MRTVLFSLALGMTYIAPPVASAAEWTDDHVVVANYYFDVLRADQSAFSLGLGYARALAHNLATKSVLIEDEERFAAMLPQALTDDLSAMYKNTVFHACFAPLSDSQAKQLAEYIISREEGSGYQSDYYLEKDLRFCVRRFSAFYWPRQDAYASVLTLKRHNPVVGDILAIPGIARFPNRVTKQDVLRAFQSP